MRKYINNLAALRFERNLSQTELAKKVGISQQKISQLEKGICQVSGFTLQKIADEFDNVIQSHQLLEEFKGFEVKH